MKVLRILAVVLLVASLGVAAFAWIRSPGTVEPAAFSEAQRLYAQQAALVRVIFNDHQPFKALLDRMWRLDPTDPGWAAFGAALSGGERAFANQTVLPALRAFAEAPQPLSAAAIAVPMPLRWAASGSPFGLPWAAVAWRLSMGPERLE